MAHVDPNHVPPENLRMQVSVDAGIPATKLLESCDVERLTASLSLISSNADRISLSPALWSAENHDQQTDVGELKLFEDLLTEVVEHIFMITPTDLNILVSGLLLVGLLTWFVIQILRLHTESSCNSVTSFLRVIVPRSFIRSVLVTAYVYL